MKHVKEMSLEEITGNLIHNDRERELCAELLRRFTELTADKARLDTLEEAIRECPDFEIRHNADEDEGTVGFVIEVGGCDPATFVDGTLRGALSRLVAGVHHNPTGKC